MECALRGSDVFDAGFDTAAGLQAANGLVDGALSHDKSLAFDGSRSQPADQVPLQRQEQRHHRQRHQERAGGEAPPLRVCSPAAQLDFFCTFDYNQRVVSPPTPLAQVIEPYLSMVWNFCSRMTLSAQRCARCHVRDLRARRRRARIRRGEAKDLELWLLKIAAHVIEKRLPPTPEVNFDMLDETLRSEATRTDVVSSLSDPQRDFLLWELKQGCMTAVVNCLSPGERAAFVVSSRDASSDEDAAKASASRRARTRCGCRARARRSATTSRRAASTSTR